MVKVIVGLIFVYFIDLAWVKYLENKDRANIYTYEIRMSELEKEKMLFFTRADR